MEGAALQVSQPILFQEATFTKGCAVDALCTTLLAPLPVVASDSSTTLSLGLNGNLTPLDMAGMGFLSLGVVYASAYAFYNYKQKWEEEKASARKATVAKKKEANVAATRDIPAPEEVANTAFQEYGELRIQLPNAPEPKLQRLSAPRPRPFQPPPKASKRRMIRQFFRSIFRKDSQSAAGDSINL